MYTYQPPLCFIPLTKDTLDCKNQRNANYLCTYMTSCKTLRKGSKNTLCFLYIGWKLSYLIYFCLLPGSWKKMSWKKNFLLRCSGLQATLKISFHIHLWDELHRSWISKIYFVSTYTENIRLAYVFAIKLHRLIKIRIKKLLYGVK